MPCGIPPEAAHKGTSRFRVCTAAEDPTHREGAFDQVGKIPLAILRGFTHPARPPPFLASLAYRFWPFACREDQFPRNTHLSSDACNQTCVSPQFYKKQDTDPLLSAPYHMASSCASPLLDKPSGTFFFFLKIVLSCWQRRTLRILYSQNLTQSHK